MTGTGPAGASRDPIALTTSAITDWLDRNAALLGGLVALRRLGSEAEDAVTAVLGLRAVRQFQLSFELFELLAESAGRDARALLRDASSVGHVRDLNQALYGRDLRLVTAP